MTKSEITEEQKTSLIACLSKATQFWLDKVGIDKSRVEIKHSINQSKINTEISCWFIINPKKEQDEK